MSIQITGITEDEVLEILCGLRERIKSYPKTNWSMRERLGALISDIIAETKTHKDFQFDLEAE